MTTQDQRQFHPEWLEILSSKLNGESWDIEINSEGFIVMITLHSAERTTTIKDIIPKKYVRAVVDNKIVMMSSFNDPINISHVYNYLNLMRHH